MKKNTQLVIFDFDGVLVDTAPDIANAANYTLEAIGLERLPNDIIGSYIGGGAEPLMRKCLGSRAEELLPTALPVFIEHYKAFGFVETHLYPGVTQVLEKLAEMGKPMAIATNKMEQLTHQILNGLDIHNYFQSIVGPESITHRKPHPESINIILDRMGFKPDQAIIIGDTWMDIESGINAGIATCGVTYGYGSREEVENSKPDFIIDKLEQLFDYIQ